MKYTISHCYIFPDDSLWFLNDLLRLCDALKCQSYENANFLVSSIFKNGQFYFKYYFPSQRNFPLAEIQVSANFKSLFSIFIHQNTKSAGVIYVYNIFEERPKALLKMFLFDVDRLTLLRPPQDIIFEHILWNTFLYHCFFFNIDHRQTHRYLGKYIERSIKLSFYIGVKFVERRPTDMSKVSLGDVCIMEFYRRFENVILTHFITFITTIFLKYSSRLPLGSKNNWVCQISQKTWKDVQRTF